MERKVRDEKNVSLCNVRVDIISSWSLCWSRSKNGTVSMHCRFTTTAAFKSWNTQSNIYTVKSNLQFHFIHYIEKRMFGYMHGMVLSTDLHWTWNIKKFVFILNICHTFYIIFYYFFFLLPTDFFPLVVRWEVDCIRSACTSIKR